MTDELEEKVRLANDGMEETEGTIVLNPEAKEKLEAVKKLAQEHKAKLEEINKVLGGVLNTLQKEHNLKVCIAVRSEDLDEMGVWKSENVNAFDEMAFVKLIEKRFR